MRKPKDERVKLPRAVRHALFSVIGLSGLACVFNVGGGGGISTSLMLLFTGVLSGLASYGFVCLLVDIKKGKNFRGVLKEINKKFKDLLNDPDWN